MKKKIIFIGGTVRSGTTLLNLILSNGNKIMALGEIFWLFNPARKHHYSLIDKLLKDNRWTNIINGGKRDLYKNLAINFPEIDVFVDSSKDPFWYNYHQRVNNDIFNVKNILIFKSPEEFAQSKLKRGETNWSKVYINYHKRYFSIIKEFYLISYKDLIINDERFHSMMNYLELDYDNNRKAYWSREYPFNFFGSNTVKKPDSHTSQGFLDKIQRKSLDYKPVSDIKIIEQVKIAKENNANLDLIFNELSKIYNLEGFDIKNELKYNTKMLHILHSKDNLQMLINRLVTKIRS